jgi:C_GCAxxG_C_C family probable redox protein
MEYSDSIENALFYFAGGYSCSQAIFAAFAGNMGISTETAFKIACGLGAGCGRSGQICGAVSGAYLVIGLKHGKEDIDDNEAKELTYKLVNEFNKRFLENFKSVNCTELIGLNLGLKEDLEKVRSENVIERTCFGIVEKTAIILGEIL